MSDPGGTVSGPRPVRRRDDSQVKSLAGRSRLRLPKRQTAWPTTTRLPERAAGDDERQRRITAVHCRCRSRWRPAATAQATRREANWAGARIFARRSPTEPCGSVQARPGIADHRTPFLGFATHQLAKLLGRFLPGDFLTGIEQLLLDFGGFEDAQQFAVQFHEWGAKSSNAFMRFATEPLFEFAREAAHFDRMQAFAAAVVDDPALFFADERVADSAERGGHFVEAVKEVARGEVWLPPDLARKLAFAGAEGANPLSKLTPREMEMSGRFCGRDSPSMVISPARGMPPKTRPATASRPEPVMPAMPTNEFDPAFELLIDELA